VLRTTIDKVVSNLAKASLGLNVSVLTLQEMSQIDDLEPRGLSSWTTLKSNLHLLTRHRNPLLTPTSSAPIAELNKSKKAHHTRTFASTVALLDLSLPVPIGPLRLLPAPMTLSVRSSLRTPMSFGGV
jgi:hypothetical protein